MADAKKKKGLFGLFGKPPEPSKEELMEKAKKDNPLIIPKSLDPDKGIKRHLVIIESMTTGLEKYYFQILRTLREPKFHGLGFDEVIKVRDLFDASVTSSFHGHIGTKVSAMQQQAQQQLATIGSMLKTMFPIVREIRIMDERLDYYRKSLAGDENAEIALKSIWIEVVEQGMQNPNSVYSLANKVGYLTLPDLFFRINPKDGSKGIDDAIKSLKKEASVPIKVIDVVAKKLFSYYNWKEHTYQEMQHTWKFRLKYLRQHYNSIKLYMNWVRPYLQTIQQLQMKGNYNDADLVNAFETSKVRLELLAQKGKGKYLTALLVKFNYVTRPELSYTPQGQKQPLHSGRLELEIEPYVVTKEQIELYIAQKDGEDIELLSSIDMTMNELKDDMKKYLVEAGEKFKEDEVPVPLTRPKGESMLEPFIAMGSGFLELFSFMKPAKGTFKGLPSGMARKEAEEKKKAEDDAKQAAWLLYDIFKKVNKMYTPL